MVNSRSRHFEIELKVFWVLAVVLPTMPSFNSCMKGVLIPDIIHDRTPDCHPVRLGMYAWMTPQLNVTWIRKIHGPLICLASFDMLSNSVCTTRHWQTSGRLVQELDVCTVCMDDPTIKHNLDSQATWTIDVLGFFWHVIRWCLYNQALAAVRSTGTGVRCLYCRYSIFLQIITAG